MRDKLTEFQHQGFYRVEDDYCDPEGQTEFNSDLYLGTSHELTIQAYATDEQALQREVVPVLEELLPLIDSMVNDLTEIDACLTQIIIFRGRLGLHFWENGVNNEFTAVYERCQGSWIFQEFGEIFS